MFRNAGRRHRNVQMKEEPTASHQPFFTKSPQSLIQRKKEAAFFQTKLSIGEPNDKYEKEADAVANAVVNKNQSASALQQMADPGHSVGKEISSIQRLATPLEDEKLSTNDARMAKDKEIQEKPGLQQMTIPEEKEDEMVQHKADGSTATASPSLSGRIESTAGKGKPLTAKTQRDMGSSFGTDFSTVNIHTGEDAVQMNKELNAQAFTHGSDIYFNQGKYDPQTTTGKQLLAHELTHVVQQGAINKKNIQRSCHDGACDSCRGGTRDFWITFYFRRRANEKTMKTIRDQINGAKAVLKNCCLNLKAEFNWSLLAGGDTFTFDKKKAGGGWTYSDDAVKLGSGNTFSGSRGIPVLIVDHVPGSGGGVTVDTSFDKSYTGRTYAVLGINDPAFLLGCNALAHELWHVAGNLPHDKALGGGIAECSGNDVNEKYCKDLRNVVAPVGDFPVPATGDTAVA
jgi:Domain of unknown function (DUF4157)